MRYKWKNEQFDIESFDAPYEKVAKALDILHPNISLAKLRELLMWGLRMALDNKRQQRTLRIRSKIKKDHVELELYNSTIRQRIAKPDWVKPVTTCTLPGVLVFGNGFDRRYLGDFDPNWELAISGVGL